MKGNIKVVLWVVLELRTEFLGFRAFSDQLACLTTGFHSPTTLSGGKVCVCPEQ